MLRTGVYPTVWIEHSLPAIPRQGKDQPISPADTPHSTKLGQKKPRRLPGSLHSIRSNYAKAFMLSLACDPKSPKPSENREAGRCLAQVLIGWC